MTGRLDRLTVHIRRLRRQMRSDRSTGHVQVLDVQAAERIDELRNQIAHLEQLVQGLQDSVYRESQRTDKRLEEIEARLQPAALAAALSRDARERGL